MNKQTFLLFIGTFAVAVIALSGIGLLLYSSSKAKTVSVVDTDVQPAQSNSEITGSVVEADAQLAKLNTDKTDNLLDQSNNTTTPGINGPEATDIVVVGSSISEKTIGTDHPRFYGQILLKGLKNGNAINLMMAIRNKDDYQTLEAKLKTLETEEAIHKFISEIAPSKFKIGDNVFVSHTSLANAKLLVDLLNSKTNNVVELDKVFAKIRSEHWFSMSGKDFFVAYEGPESKIAELQVLESEQQA